MFDKHELQIPAVAILVGLAVVAPLVDSGYLLPVAVAILIAGFVAMLCFRVIRGWRLRVFTGVSASVFAIAAVIFGFGLTRLAFYDGGHGRPPWLAPLSDWLEFAAINAILAAVSGILGGVLGLVIGLVMERMMGSHKARPPAAGAEGAPKRHE